MRRILALGSALCMAGALVVQMGWPAPAAAATTPSSSLPADAAHVDSLDDFFSPSTVDIARGGAVSWDFTGENHHSATDGTGLGLYDSGVVAGGAPSTWFTFPAAGTYPFVCILHAQMVGRVHVPVRAAPARGDLRRRFTVTWAVAASADSDVYDVQIRRPDGGWKGWRIGVSGQSHAFVQDAGVGSYRFRARMRDPATGAAADWSLPTEIRVTR
jgi:plastocyanin